MTDHSFHQAHPGIEVSVKPGMAHNAVKRKRLRLRTTLMRSRDYKHRLLHQNRNPDTVRALRLAHLSQWIWVIEAIHEPSARGNRPSTAAEITYDYTSSDHNPTRLAISHQIGTAILPPDNNKPQRIGPIEPGHWKAHHQTTISRPGEEPSARALPK